MASLVDKTAIRKTGTHTYTSRLHDEWCIGTVPHGGVVTTSLLRVAALHFSTTLSAQNQPDCITLHLEFLRRTSAGPVQYTVRDVKLGRQASVIHITLTQESREEVVGYITHSNIGTESGVSFDTKWTLNPPTPPVDLGALRRAVQAGGTGLGEDANWSIEQNQPFSSFRKAMIQTYMALPRRGQAMESLADEWLALRSGERWTNTTLGFACDMWPQLVDQMRISQITAEERISASEAQKRPKGPFWYPTLLLNIDVKKRLPEGGVDWLFVRAQAKTIKNGRYDIEVIVLDEEGDIVALSHHVALAVSAKRNTSERRKTDAPKESKI